MFKTELKKADRGESSRVHPVDQRAADSASCAVDRACGRWGIVFAADAAHFSKIKKAVAGKPGL